MRLNWIHWNDSSAWVLLASNILTAFFALTNNWGLLTLVWGYWLQSIIIGFFTFLKLGGQSAKKPFWSGFARMIKGKERISGTAETFAFIYGLFHLVYLFFLAVFTFLDLAPAMGPVDWPGFLLIGIIFFVNHAYSFWYTFAQAKTVSSTEEQFFLNAFLRVIPMHLTIVIGFGLVFAGAPASIALLVFLGGKTIADVLSHFLQHRNDSFVAAG